MRFFCDFVLSWNRNFACIARKNIQHIFVDFFEVNIHFGFTDGKLLNKWMVPNFVGSNQARH